MKQSINIRQFYKPVQPANLLAEDVVYHEFEPDTKLQEFVYCYWQLKTENRLSTAYSYRVVADGCIDIFFDLDNLQDSSVMGFCKQYTEFSLNETFNYIGVRFLPTMFTRLFNIDASELANRSESLNLVLPELSRFVQQRITQLSTLQEIKQVFDTFFLHYLAKNEIHNSPVFCNAISAILNNYQTIRIEKDLNIELSSRQLRRLFQFYVGDTVKSFVKVVRFQSILQTQPSMEYMKRNKLFFDAGYFDQAHFIKDFKKLYGATPSKAFGE